VGLRDVETGETFPFKTAAAAEKFLDVRGKTLPNRFPNGPISERLFAGIGGVGVQVPHSVGVDNVQTAARIISTSRILPSISYFLRAENDMIKKIGYENTPRMFAAVSDVAQAATRMRAQERLWVKKMMQIRGKGLRSKSIREEKFHDFVEMFERPRTEWADFAKERGLSGQEIKAGEQLRELYNEMFEFARRNKAIDITAEDFLTDYFPHYMRKDADSWVAAVSEDLARRGKAPLPQTIEFVSEMAREGTLTKYEKDPFMITLQYIRGLAFAGEMRPAWESASRLANTVRQQGIDGRNRSLTLMGNLMHDYLSLVKSGRPEQQAEVKIAMTETVKRVLGLELSSKEIDRLTNAFIGLNYGAFMGFRPGLAIRNMSQTLVTTLPFLGGKYTAHGMRAVLGKNGRGLYEEAVAAGAVMPGSIALPMEDVIYAQALRARTKGALGKKAATAMATVEGSMTRFSAWSLQGQLEIGGREIPFPGVYGGSDTFNRLIAYAGGKKRALDAFNDFKLGKIGQEKMLERAGAMQLGEAAQREVTLRLQKDGVLETAKWMGTQTSNFTQFMYQTGTGPRIFAHGAGKVFGMYGTWPTWYADFMARGLSTGTMQDKMRFVAWTGITHAAMASSATTLGINMSRWMGLTSFGWAGGPAFEFFKDMTDIWGGVDVRGEPTPSARTALGRRGIKDPGPSAGIRPFRYELDDPQKLAWETLGFFTPGAFALRDWMAASELPRGSKEQMIRAIGLQPVAPGQNWPGVIVK
jgi:hypothetical protein